MKDCVSIKLYCFKYCTDIVSLIVYALFSRACISRKRNYFRSRAYFVKNISTLLFLRHLSTLDNYSRFFTLNSRLFTLDSRRLLSTLDIYSPLSTFYSRLSTFTLDSRESLLSTFTLDSLVEFHLHSVSKKAQLMPFHIQISCIAGVIS